MTFSELTPWIEHLKEPLVLIAFVITLFCSILRIIVLKGIIRISKKSLEQLMQQILLYLFIIGIIVIVFSFGFALKKTSRTNNNSIETISQKTKGEQSPAIITKGKNSRINITYGVFSQEKSPIIKRNTDKDTKTGSSELTKQNEQHTERN